LGASLVSFAAITLCVASQRVFIVVHFVIDSVRKLLDTPWYNELHNLYASSNIVTVIKSRMRWVVHAARMGEMENLKEKDTRKT